MSGTGNLVFIQYYVDCLSQASYLVGDRGTGRAVVVDPRRDVSGYLADAASHGLRIERVVETHVHADFLSGHLELAAATGARICYGDAARVDFPVDPLADGQRISLGDVELEILHTPGHTPESVSIVVWDGEAVPYGVLTGDTLFVGDVGRPDLLGADGWSSDALARALYRSVRKLLTLPDGTRVFPAHGAGSACGKNLSPETSSTIGAQRRANYALAPMTEDDFVRTVCEGQSPAPAYFAFTSVRNREQRPTLAEHEPVPDLLPMEVGPDAVVLDTRDAAEFARSHLPGAINAGLTGRFAETAGQVLRAEDPLVLVCSPGKETEARNRLARIGFDRVIGCIDASLAAGQVAVRMTPADLADVHRERQVVDVRKPGEVRASGVVPGAVLLPLPELLDRLGELDPERPTVVYCAGGYRSSAAASLLRARGFTDITDLEGGFTAWSGFAVGSASRAPSRRV
ncbi:rhodanese-like domain-containing protein [Amycolatopsis sp. NPDC059027]|uniref:MBL fold metallo-hydrolase n=1 Tax=Amycolatopsis sp. NPDC059027 TaxID=3346709 RepID=UPI0036702CF3